MELIGLGMISVVSIPEMIMKPLLAPAFFIMAINIVCFIQGDSLSIFVMTLIRDIGLGSLFLTMEKNGID